MRRRHGIRRHGLQRRASQDALAGSWAMAMAVRWGFGMVGVVLTGDSPGAGGRGKPRAQRRLAARDGQCARTPCRHAACPVGGMQPAPPLRPATGSWLARQAAQPALARALPAIEAQLRDREVSGTGFLHIVVMDPGIAPGTAAFEHAILLEHSIGEPAHWDADYAKFARAKALLSWRHQLDGHMLQTRHPQWLQAGDTMLWGGVCLDGIVVATSGAHPWYDEAFGLMLAGLLRAEIKRLAALHAAAGMLFVPGSPA
jgi:hypothetical protein